MRCVSDWTQTTWRRTLPTPTTRVSKWPCLLLFCSLIAQANGQNLSIISALLTYSYTDMDTGEMVKENGTGKYGIGSLAVNGSGVVVHVRVAETEENHGCWDYINVNNESVSSDQPWIALVQRGKCKFQQKVDMATLHNASAIVIYDHNGREENGRDILIMDHEETNMATVFVQHSIGQRLASLVDSHIPVYLTIAVAGRFDVTGANLADPPNGPNKHTTVVLLVFVGFLIVGLIVVVVYAVRHAKYVHARHQASLAITLQETHQAQENLLNHEGVPDQSQQLQSQIPQQQQQQQQQQQSHPQPQQPQQQQPQPQDQQQNNQHQNDHSSSLLPH